MSEQLQFDLAAKAAEEERKAALSKRRDALLAVLRGNGWMTRRKLEEHGFDERELREVVEDDADCRIFSYPGSPGYKLFEDVTDAEFDRCVALKSQGKRMMRRWIGYQRRWHRRFK